MSAEQLIFEVSTLTNKMINCGDKYFFRKLVVCMEDNILKLYTPEARIDLQNIYSPSWESVFKSYIESSYSPIQSTNVLDQLVWLMYLAIGKSSGDEVDHKDFFKKNIEDLADICKITKHTDYMLTLNEFNKYMDEMFKCLECTQLCEPKEEYFSLEKEINLKIISNLHATNGFGSLDSQILYSFQSSLNIIIIIQKIISFRK